MSERFRIGDRLIQTRNSHELGLMNGSIVFLRADDPERGGDRRRHRRGRLAGDPLRGDGDAAPRLRDLGPQGAGLRGAGRGRRLPPLPRPDADPPAPLHRDHPRPQQLRPDRRPRRAGDGGPPRRQRQPATRAWPSACASASALSCSVEALVGPIAPTMLAMDVESPRPSLARGRRHPGRGRAAGRAGARGPGAARRLRRGGPRRHRRRCAARSRTSASPGRC